MPATTTVRRFEFAEGSSNKFWEVSVDGCDLTTRWGRIGTDGQSKTKSFPTAEKATAEYGKLIADKVGKGYREIGGSTTPEPARPIPLEEALQNALDESTETGSTAPLLREIFQRADEIEQLLIEEKSDSSPQQAEIPDAIHLERVGENRFVNAEAADDLAEEIVSAGFYVAGSFTVREMPLVLRAFHRAPNVLAVIFELGQFVWVDLSVTYADGTKAEWTNAPMHDGLQPPWMTLVIVDQGDFHELHDMLIAERSEKPPATLSADDFATHFEQEYARSRQWRSSLRGDAASQPVSKRIEDQVVAFARAYRKLQSFSPVDAAPEGAELLRLPPVEQIEVVKACFLLPDRMQDLYRSFEDLRERLLKRNLPYVDADLEFLAEELKESARDGLDKYLLGAIERRAKEHTLSAKARQLLREARDRSRPAGYYGHDEAKLKGRIDALVGDDANRIPIVSKEVWADAAIADIEQMAASKRVAWIRLMQHGVTATAGKPSAAWIKEAQSLIAAVTRPELLAYACKWFPLIDKPWTGNRSPMVHGRDPLSLAEPNQDILRGLIWCCSLEADLQMARTLGAMAISAYRKIPQVGARAVRVGNACVYGLGAMQSADGVSQLAILKVKVKFGTAQRFVEQELTKAATRLGLPREELEEMSVPAYGLDEVGIRRETLGDYTAELAVDASGSTELRWLKADGTPQKSAPAAVQKEFAEELKELKAAAKDIQKMVPVQRERIDGLFLAQKRWPLPAWRERYLDHPLVGVIARRLIWRFGTGQETAAGIFCEGQLVCLDDVPIRGLGEETTVELWHPIELAHPTGQPLEEIQSWRLWLERHEVQQPFKQAHREVYLLTDAERGTRVYSNRFAAHILRQPRLRALASARGWQCPLIGPWDGGDCTRATRRLPQWGDLEAQLWINSVEGDLPAGDDDFSGAGWAYVSTDQVRFYAAGDPNDPLPLADVPSLVFSEIMRDVDLFVGVTSVGNDPTWSDGGPGGHHVDYWTSYAFGDLSATAQTRRQVLERLVPRLKIADRCTISDRFLVVRGDLRTYKIHLGSGNILMLPNDQYLCIVPNQAAKGSDKLYLPFEGDNTLSIILSKAFLLAEDAKIKDPTITSQIKSNRSS